MNQRKRLEETLKNEIARAEEEIAQDPKLKAMIDQLRSMYWDNSEDVLFAMGFGAPQPGQNSPGASSPVKPKLPESRIPHLIYLLDSISKRSMNLPDWKRNLALDPPSLTSSFDIPLSANGASFSFNPALSEKELREKRTELRQKQMELDRLNHDYTALKSEEPAIQKRSGKYAIPAERLKAERRLRETPGAIAQMVHEINALREELDRRS